MEDLTKTHTELLERKATLHGISTRLDAVEGKISELGDTKMETIQSEHTEKKESAKMSIRKPRAVGQLPEAKHTPKWSLRRRREGPKEEPRK